MTKINDHSAFELFLKEGIHFEITHQVILEQLLTVPAFTENLFGISGQGRKPVREFDKGTFDLALVDASNELIFGIEIKVWSGLGNRQRDDQIDYLRKEKKTGAHLLLGPTHFEYRRSGDYDQMEKVSDGISQKIGFPELIHALEKTMDAFPSQSMQAMAQIYASRLRKEWDELTEAWRPENMEKVSWHVYYYSLYYQIQIRVKGIYTRIYKVNNPSGTKYILNDQDSWFGCHFKGCDFEVYHEFLDGVYMIRMWTDTKGEPHRKELKGLINDKLKETAIGHYDWDRGGRVSKYTIICRITLPFDTEAHLDEAANLMRETREALSEVVGRIE